MDLALSPEDEAFRAEVRHFLDEQLTEDLREAGNKTAGVFAEMDAGLRWHRILTKKGWSAPACPGNTAAPAGRRRSAISSRAKARRSMRRASFPWACAWSVP